MVNVSDERKRGSVRYVYMVMLVFYAGLSYLIYTAAGGISQTIGLPGYLDVVFRGSVLLSFLVFGLFLLYPLISSNSSSTDSGETSSSSRDPKPDTRKRKPKPKPKGGSASSDRYGQLKDEEA